MDTKSKQVFFESIHTNVYIIVETSPTSAFQTVGRHPFGGREIYFRNS